MRVHTHLAFAILIGLICAPYFGGGWVFVLFAAFGAILPDIDHKESFINKKLKITKIIPYFAEHRGIFHSVFAAVAVLALFWVILKRPYAIGIFAGYLSHLFMDSFTKAGVCYLHPLKIFHVKGPFRTGGIGELILFAICVVGILLLAFG